MGSTEHKVALVVDVALGHMLGVLARTAHVWVVESAQNTPAMRAFWQAEPRLVTDDSDADLAGPGITSFAADPDEPLEAQVLRLLDDIEDHHGGFAHDPAWSAIEVVGLALSPVLEQALRDLGASSFATTTTGFVARR